jgi:Protein of unknown function (DUF2946)
MAPWLRIWLRTAVGWIAAYALVLQTTLAAFAANPVASLDPALAFDPVAIICLNSSSSSADAMLPDRSGGGGHPSHVSDHCGLCAVSGPVLAAAITAAIDQLSPARSNPAVAATDQVAHIAASPLPGRPRAPPTTM